MLDPKTLIFIFLFYLLVVFQVSFLPHFQIAGAVFNLTFVFVLLFNFFEKPENKTGILAALIGGALLDVFSLHPVGVFTLTLVALSFLIKRLVPFFRRTSLVSFFVVFLIAFLFNSMVSWFLSETLNILFKDNFVFVLSLNWQMLCWGLLLNFILAVSGFLMFGRWISKLY